MAKNETKAVTKTTHIRMVMRFSFFARFSYRACAMAAAASAASVCAAATAAAWHHAIRTAKPVGTGPI